MTTILADWHLGVIAADTSAQDGDRQWLGERKVFRVGAWLLAFAGSVEERGAFIQWWRDGRPERTVRFKYSSALAMHATEGLLMFNGCTLAIPVDHGREAIGTGAKCAMAAYEALGWLDPRMAVRIACKHDAGSRPPVRVYKLKGR